MGPFHTDVTMISHAVFLSICNLWDAEFSVELLYIKRWLEFVHNDVINKLTTVSDFPFSDIYLYTLSSLFIDFFRISFRLITTYLFLCVHFFLIITILYCHLCTVITCTGLQFVSCVTLTIIT